MTMGYNPLDPMCASEYMSYLAPIDTLINSVSLPPVNPCPLEQTPNAPQLKPQLKEDKFYKFDGNDDGKINKWEKLKAFAKGSTCNILKTMFCNEKGFSLKRTALTLGSAALLAMTGPIGVAIAGGVGLVAGLSKFVNACKLSNVAEHDSDARTAYEKLGEASTTMCLSLFGGFKGLKCIRNNGKFIKANPTSGFSLRQKVHNWKLS